MRHVAKLQHDAFLLYNRNSVEIFIVSPQSRNALMIFTVIFRWQLCEYYCSKHKNTSDTLLYGQTLM